MFFGLFKSKEERDRSLNRAKIKGFITFGMGK